MTSPSIATDRLTGEISLTELDQVAGGLTAGEKALIAAAVASPMGAAVAGAAAGAAAAWMGAWAIFY